MIRPIQIRQLSFGTSEENIARLSSMRAQNVSAPAPALKEDSVELPAKKQPKEKKESIFHKIKTGVLNIVKGINTTTGVVGGFLKGIIPAALTGIAIGLFGKNLGDRKLAIKQAQEALKDKAQEIGKEAGEEAAQKAKVILPAIGGAFKDLFRTPKKFFSQYLKGHKVTKATVVVGTISVLALSTLIGKMKANKKNADVDHYTNEGHTK